MGLSWFIISKGIWLLAEDFNVILGASERVECSRMVCMGCHLFQRFVFDQGLRDLGCVGSKFTWSRGGLSQRLDRAICNGDWDVRFLNCRVRNLHRLNLIIVLSL